MSTVFSQLAQHDAALMAQPAGTLQEYLDKMRDSEDTGFLLVASQPVLLSCPVAELQEELVPGRGRLLILLSDLDTAAGRRFIEKRLGLRDFVMLHDPIAADSLARDWTFQVYPICKGNKIKAPDEIGALKSDPEAGRICRVGIAESDWILSLGDDWSAALIIRRQERAFYVLDVLYHKLGRFGLNGELERLVNLERDYWLQGELASLAHGQELVLSGIAQDPLLLNSILAPHSYHLEMSERGILIRTLRRYPIIRDGKVRLTDIAFFNLFDYGLLETDSFNAVPVSTIAASERVGESFVLDLGHGLFLSSSEAARDDPDCSPSLILWEQFGGRIEPIDERRIGVLDSVFQVLRPAALYRLHASQTGRGFEADSLWLFASYAAAGFMLTSDSLYQVSMWQPKAHLQTSVKREGELIIPEIRYRNRGIKVGNRQVWCLEEKGPEPDRWLIEYSKSTRSVHHRYRLPEYLQQAAYLWLELSKGRVRVYGAEKVDGQLFIRVWSPSSAWSPGAP